MRRWFYTQSSGPPQWTPAKLGSKLAFWHDTSLGSQVDANGGVFQWDDLSGNGFHATQTVEARRPTINPTGMAGMPTLTFDGSNDFLNAIAPCTSAATRSIFIVVRPRNVVGESGSYFVEGGYSGQGVVIHVNQNNRRWSISVGSSALQPSDYNGVATEPMLLECSVVSGNLIRGAMNSDPQQSATFTHKLNSYSTAYFGRTPASHGNDHALVDIAAALGTYGATTPEETALIREYFRNRYPFW